MGVLLLVVFDRGMLVMFSAAALRWITQLPLRVHGDPLLWRERISAIVSRREATTRGLMVFTTMPLGNFVVAGGNELVSALPPLQHRCGRRRFR